MSYNPNMVRRVFPARIANLGFAIDLPDSWVVHDLPDDAPDFSDPTVMVPLAVAAAPHAMLVFAAAARPAYDDGTLHDWAWYLINSGPMTPRAVGRGNVGTHDAIIGEAVQDSDFGEMVTRFAFFVDEGRLVSLTMSAPAELAGLVSRLWLDSLASFELSSPGVAAAADPEPYSEAVSEVLSEPLDESAAAVEQEPAIESAPADVVDTSIAGSGELDWRARVHALAHADRVAEAEAMIMQHVDHLGAYASIAHMHAARMYRLVAAGDTAGAAAAHEAATDWIWRYAASATSGGEGVALSAERDQFLQQLGDPPLISS